MESRVVSSEVNVTSTSTFVPVIYIESFYR